MTDATWQEKWDAFQKINIESVHNDQARGAIREAARMEETFTEGLRASSRAGGLALRFAFDVLGDMGAIQDQAYKELKDTHFRMSIDENDAVLESLGFEKVLTDDIGEEEVRIWARPDGLVIVTDTYNGNRNGGKLYLLLEPDEDFKNDHYLGAVDIEGKKYYYGYKDIREGLRMYMQDLQEHGTFVPKWTKDITTRGGRINCLSMICEQDYSHLRRTKGFEDNHKDNQKLYAEINAVHQSRLERVPHWVRQMLGHEAGGPYSTPQISQSNDYGEPA